MGWLSAAERLSAIDRKAVVFDTDRCLHSMDKFIECELCYQICPVEAIKPGKPPVFAQDTCQTCLACIPVCPTGAYSAEDAVPALMKCVIRMEGETLELGCEAHPMLDEGPDNSEAAVRVRGCLAGLGLGGYLSMFALGKEQLVIRLDACQDCPWGALQAQILRQIESVRTLLGIWDMTDQLTVVLSREGVDLHECPVWEADNPPLSRRDLFRFASERSRLLAARVINADSGKRAERRPAPDRLRMAAAIAQLPEFESKLTDFPGLANLKISDTCTACSACARACPTQALRFNQQEFKTFQLKFQPDYCIGCGICQQVCFPEAITIDHSPQIGEIFGSEALVVLIEGELGRCERCNAVIASRMNSHLCPLCEYRRANPFSAQLPPRLLQLIQNQAKSEKKP